MKILIPLPRTDFDPSEAAVSWRILNDAGHTISFATPDGREASADPIMLTGVGLDAWSRIPVLRHLILVGAFLRADANARRAYREMERDSAFREPMLYADVDVRNFDALLLPGGHAQGMREYLESETLQKCVANFFDEDKPVAAVCHGVVLAARSVSSRTGKSVLFGRKTTALTWKLEKSGWMLSRYAGRFWDRDYYRTYRESASEPAGFRSVQSEVMRALERESDFLDVPSDAPNQFRKSSGLFRDNDDDARPAFVVRDGNYLSARWPGDVHTFAHRFAQLLDERRAKA